MTQRPSSYIIQSNTDRDDEVLLMHGYTKAMDVVPRRVADALSDPTRPLAPAVLAGEEVEVLARRGYLTSLDPDAERKGFLALITAIDAGVRGNIKPQFVLMPTYVCNLNCFYCYQKPAIESDDELTKHSMTVEMAEKAFTACKGLLREGDTLAGSELFLYGGEPLLRANRRLIEYSVNRALAEGMRIRAVTNGTQLEAFEDLLGPKAIANLQITLDGPRHIHDTRRITHGGKGSFDKIAKNIDLALSKDVKVAIRINVDTSNIEALEELNGFCKERGWLAHKNVSVYATTIGATSGQAEWIDGKSLVTESDVAQKVLEQSLGISTMNDAMRSQVTRAKRSKLFEGFKTGFCGANFSMMVFDWKGNTYACWDEVEQFKPSGHYRDGKVVFDKPVLDTWQRSPLIKNPRCHDCAFAFHCGGGCDWHGKNDGDAYYDHYCPDFANRFRATMAEEYVLAREAAERGAQVKKNGERALSREQKADVLREVGAILAKRNVSQCTSSCSSEVVRDEANGKQKKSTALVQLRTKRDAAPAA